MFFYFVSRFEIIVVVLRFMNIKMIGGYSIGVVLNCRSFGCFLVSLKVFMGVM